MKRVFLIVVSNLILLNTCFAIDALQLKNARVAAYQWVRDYEIYSQLNAKRNARMRFLSLFQSGDVVVVNEYLPLLNQKGNTIKASELADLILNKSSVYKIAATVDSAYITSERIADLSTVEYEVMLKKSIAFVDRKSYADTCAAYPKINVSEVATLRYDVLSGTIVAVSITSEDMIKEVHILHNATASTIDSVNLYVTPASFKNIGNTDNVVITAMCVEIPQDPQIFTIAKDTFKTNFHIGASVGFATYSADIDSRFSNFEKKNGLYYAFNVGFYSQFLVKGKNRFGIEYDLKFIQSKYGMSANYDDNYLFTDEDEHKYTDARQYTRYVDIDNYTETAQRYSLEIPVLFRYDRFVSRKISVFVKLGFAISYDVITKATAATDDALYYGVYDWMGGIRIDNYPEYGFGKYALSESTKNLGFGKLGVSILAGVGAQLFISKQWSMDFGLYYANMVYNKVNKESDYRLTQRQYHGENSTDDWTTATKALSKFNASNMNFQLQFNYNF